MGERGREGCDEEVREAVELCRFARFKTAFGCEKNGLFNVTDRTGCHLHVMRLWFGNANGLR